MPHCAAVNCDFRTAKFKSRKQLEYEKKIGKKVTLYKFPKNPDRRKAWIKAVKRKDWVPNKNSFLCCKHFHETDFEEGYCIRRLKDDSVPSIFEFPENLKVKLKLKKRKLESHPSPEEPSSSLLTTPDMSDEASTSPGGSEIQIIEQSPIKLELRQELFHIQLNARKKIKFLQETIRRKEKRIVCLKNMINTLNDDETE